MKKLIMTVAFALVATGAIAADLPRRTAPVAPAMRAIPTFTWTGAYAGVNAGYGFGEFTKYGASRLQKPSGFVGGAQIGYNHQVDQMVYGLETDLDYANLTAKNSGGGVAGSKGSVNYIGTVRGRFGVAIDRIMPYVTGGFAYGGTTISVPGIGKTNSLHTGWVVGGGLEYAITNNLTARVEGLYVDLSDKRVLGGAGKVGAETAIIRAGINAKF